MYFGEDLLLHLVSRVNSTTNSFQHPTNKSANDKLIDPSVPDNILLIYILTKLFKHESTAIKT